jgi:hypothetical protein
MATPNLAIVHIAAAQNQPEVTANGAFDALDDSVNLKVSIAMTDADKALTQAQLASGGAIMMTGALTADRHINLPVTINRCFIFQNGTTGGHNLIVQVTGAPGTTVTIAAAAGLVELFSDGTNVVQLTGGSVSGQNFADNETPGGTIDGSNTALTLAHSPNPAGSLLLMQAPSSGGAVVLIATVDYMLSGANITMTNPPASGDKLRASYRY